MALNRSSEPRSGRSRRTGQRRKIAGTGSSRSLASARPIWTETWWFKGLALILTTLSGFLLGALSPLGSQVANVALDPDVVADRFRSGDPIEVQFEQLHEGSRGWTRFAFPDSLQLSAEEEQFLLAGNARGIDFEEYDAYYNDLVRSRGGVPVDFLSANITMTGARDQVVRIRDIRVVVDSADPPLVGGLLCDYIGGADEPTIISQIDLDRERPIFEVSYDGRSTWEPLVSSRSVTLERKEKVTFNLNVRTSTQSVRFHLALDYEVGGERGTVLIDDLGSPFAITARAASIGDYIDANAYRSVWTYDSNTGNFVKGSPATPYSQAGVCL